MSVSYSLLPYSDVEAPILEITVLDPLQSQSLSVQALIDTGFDGELIIPLPVFEKLGLYSYELSKDQFSIAETASGERLNLVSAYGMIVIDILDLEVEVIIDSHEKCQEIILGRTFLQDFDLRLFGTRGELRIEVSQ